jgi:hypothetical protein
LVVGLLCLGVELVEVLHAHKECVHGEVELIRPDLHVGEERPPLTQVGRVLYPMGEAPVDLGTEEANGIGQCGKTTAFLLQGGMAVFWLICSALKTVK